MSSERKTFIDSCLAGEAFADEIDDFVDEWHDGDDTRDLNEFLGMTSEEYATWVERPESLNYIVFAHKNQMSLEDALKYNNGAYSIAARGAANAEEQENLVLWLKRTGRVN